MNKETGSEVKDLISLIAATFVFEVIYRATLIISIFEFQNETELT